MKNEGCVSLKAMPSDILHFRGPHCLSLPGYFLCVSSLSTLHVIASLYYTASLYWACHLTIIPFIFRQAPKDFLFYMLSISLNWLLTPQTYSFAVLKYCFYICQPGPPIGKQSKSSSRPAMSRHTDKDRIAAFIWIPLQLQRQLFCYGCCHIGVFMRFWEFKLCL